MKLLKGEFTWHSKWLSNIYAMKLEVCYDILY